MAKWTLQVDLTARKKSELVVRILSIIQLVRVNSFLSKFIIINCFSATGNLDLYFVDIAGVKSMNEFFFFFLEVFLLPNYFQTSCFNYVTILRWRIQWQIRQLTPTLRSIIFINIVYLAAFGNTFLRTDRQSVSLFLLPWRINHYCCNLRVCYYARMKCKTIFQLIFSKRSSQKSVKHPHCGHTLNKIFILGPF